MKVEKLIPPEAKADPIRPEQREAWRQWMLSMSPYPPEEWVDKIKADRPSQITTTTSGEYLAVCDLDRAGLLIVSGVSNPKGAPNGTCLFSIHYPQAEQKELIL